MKTVEMPKMGDTMEEGKILHWLKKEGETVKKGEPIAEVETDKVNIEIESFSSGILRKILVQEGSSAPIGAGIALVGTADEPLPGDTGNTASATATAQPTQLGVDVNLGYSEIQSSNAISTVSARASAVAQSSAVERGRVFISPIARRLAEEYQLDYTRLQGTGPNGRIIKMDVEAALATHQAPSAPLAQPVPALPLMETYVEPRPEPTAVPVGDVVEIPLTAMRRTIARRLSQSMQTAPHIYVTSVIDTGKLASLRQQINDFAATDPEPVKVSFDALIVKAVALALTRMPEINVSFADDRLIMKKQINIGVAVSLEQGLIVPVIRNANQRGILDIARDIRRLAEAARTGKLRPEDYSGGTFTISNLGMYDVESFTAVINQPEAAILAIGSIIPTPAVVDGQVMVRDRMHVTLSADHRAIDGAPAARFLQQLKHLLEEPFGLLL